MCPGADDLGGELVPETLRELSGVSQTCPSEGPETMAFTPEPSPPRLRPRPGKSVPIRPGCPSWAAVQLAAVERGGHMTWTTSEVRDLDDIIARELDDVTARELDDVRGTWPGWHHST